MTVMPVVPLILIVTLDKGRRELLIADTVYMSHKFSYIHFCNLNPLNAKVSSIPIPFEL